MRPIPREAIEVHGITNAKVATAPNMASIAWRLLDRVKWAQVLVGYNWTFDAAMIRAEFIRLEPHKAFVGLCE